MRNTFYALLPGTLLFSCRKQDTVVNHTDNYAAVAQASLRDSLSEADYASLDYAHGIASSVDSLYIRVLRVPRYGKSVVTNFFVGAHDKHLCMAPIGAVVDVSLVWFCGRYYSSEIFKRRRVMIELIQFLNMVNPLTPEMVQDVRKALQVKELGRTSIGFERVKCAIT